MLSYRQYGQKLFFIVVSMYGVKAMHGNGHDLFDLLRAVLWCQSYRTD